MNLVRATGTIGGLTLVSRILGLFRDSLFARFVGAGFASDAFLVALRLPNMFRALFAEGAFSSAFIPMFNQKSADPDGEGLTDGLAFAERALSVLLPVLVVMTVILELFAWPITWLLSGKFHGVSAAQFAFAVHLSRLTIPYLALISVVSLLGGILNSLHRYAVNAAAPILLNVTLILALLVFHGSDPMVTARNQALAVSVAGVLQLGWLVRGCRRAGVRLRLRAPVLDHDVRKLMRLVAPAAMGSSATQINLLISTALAASLLAHGSVTYIYMADRLNQLPLGLIGIGLGTVLLPTLSRQLGAGEAGEAMATQNRALELALLLSLPAAVGLIFGGDVIVSALFGYGRYQPADIAATAQALAAFALGLPAYILVKVLTPGYYARQDTKTPVRFGLISMAVNLGLNVLLILPLKHMGPPLATAVASTVNAVLLYTTLRRRGHFEPDHRLTFRSWRLAVAALTMGAVLWISEGRLMVYIHHGWAIRLLVLALLVSTGALVYGVATIALGAFSRDDLTYLLRRARP